MKKYEAMIILSHTVDDNSLEAKLEKVRAEMAQCGAQNINLTRMGRRSFARPLKGRQAGIYIMASFQAEPDRIQPLRDRLTRFRQDDDIFRAQIVLAPARKSKAEKPAASEAGAGAASGRG